jgi:cell division septation protein DedD
MDQLISLEERRKGVALAQELASGRGGAQPKTAASPKVASATPPAKAAAPVIAPAAKPGGAFRIQLGAFRDSASAERLFASLGSRLNGASMILVPSGTMTRLQVGPYPTRAAASAACAALKPQPCFPLAAR